MGLRAGDLFRAGDRVWLGAVTSPTAPSPPGSWVWGSGSLLHGLQAGLHGSRPSRQVRLGLEGLGRRGQEEAVELGGHHHAEHMGRTWASATRGHPRQPCGPRGCQHSPPQRSLPSSPGAGGTVWRVAGQGCQGAGPPSATPGWLQTEKNDDEFRGSGPNQAPRPRCQVEGIRPREIPKAPSLCPLCSLQRGGGRGLTGTCAVTRKVRHAPTPLT